MAPVIEDIDISDFLMKTGAAIVAGFFMGLERQIKGKPAGLKTNTLVALGATVFIIVSFAFANDQGTDMTRILGQIVVGVGFLGAGVILQREKEYKVAGLATAATIWCSAAAGCLAALGLYLPLLLFTAMVVVINLAFGYLNSKLPKRETDDMTKKENDN